MYFTIICECNGKYIEETKQTLEVRLKEHKTNVKTEDMEHCTLAEHVWKHDHWFIWEKQKSSIENHIFLNINSLTQ